MNDSIKQPECPECERLSAVAPQSQKVGEFLEWLQQEKGYALGQYHEHSEDCRGNDGFNLCGFRKGELVPAHFSMETTLAEFFNIDLTKVENERRALLEYLRDRKQA